MTTSLDESARTHLVRADRQEDMCFALWYPSQGETRSSALLQELVLPQYRDRDVRGNVRFQPAYFERAIAAARADGAGLALLHSHPTRGWQGLSQDDEKAESENAAAVLAATGLPFVGLTLAARDGTWSARFWERKLGRNFTEQPCESVRVVGEHISVSYHPDLRPPAARRPQLRRTIDAWGPSAQADLARLRITVIGAGSVGTIVLEGLARMGVAHVGVLDFDSVEIHNQDRALHFTAMDIGSAKVAVVQRELQGSATAANFAIDDREDSICEEDGYRAALDADVLMSCVDRPWPRSILNFIAYAHLIPVVDGGIAVSRTPLATMRSADWKAHVATPGRRCLECVGQFDAGFVQADREGRLDDPRYIEHLPADHALRSNENVFAFSLAVASLELLQLIQLVIAPAGVGARWAQTYHFPAALSDLDGRGCESSCAYPRLESRGDRAGSPGTARHFAAEQAREKRRQSGATPTGSEVSFDD